MTPRTGREGNVHDKATQESKNRIYIAFGKTVVTPMANTS